MFVYLSITSHIWWRICFSTNWFVCVCVCVCRMGIWALRVCTSNRYTASYYKHYFISTYFIMFTNNIVYLWHTQTYIVYSSVILFCVCFRAFTYTWNIVRHEFRRQCVHVVCMRPTHASKVLSGIKTIFANLYFAQFLVCAPPDSSRRWACFALG